MPSLQRYDSANTEHKILFRYSLVSLKNLLYSTNSILQKYKMLKSDDNISWLIIVENNVENVIASFDLFTSWEDCLRFGNLF